MNNKSLIVSVIVVFLIAIGAYFFPKMNSFVGAVSPSGSYFNDQNASSIVFSPLTGTSTSILNNGGSDRAITAIRIYCSSIGTSHTFLTGNTGTGADLASWQLSAATTSIANLGLQGNANYILASGTVISTSTGNGLFYIASTTEGVLAYASRIWPVNSYLTFNTNATNTATCSYDADWISL